MKSNWLIATALGLFFCGKSEAQAGKYELTIHRTTAPISLDGNLDEPIWQTADLASQFKMNYPADTAFSQWQTEARLAFDDRNLYVAYTCWQKREDYVVQSLRRDYGPGTTDVVNIYLDPTRDGLNAFIFSVSPLNVQREGLISAGKDQSYIWDNKWRSAVRNFDDRWTVEVAIPFKTLRYKLAPVGQPNRWGLQFIRTRMKNFEVSTWSPVPAQFLPSSLAFEGALVWADAPPRPGANVSLIPYATAGFSEDFPRSPALEKLPTERDFTRNIGGDAKIGVTPGLNLDLTFNPDFSQVEVDRQVANVSRFELFFPETRQFFLENADLMGTFGFPSSRPFFSRRVGLARNPATGLYEKVPIVAGARLSGKLTDGLRVGLLNLTTREKEWAPGSVVPGANVTVATLQQRLRGRSTIGGIFVDKEQFLGKLTEAEKAGHQGFNRMAGLEYNLYSDDNKWEGEAYWHRSFSPDKKKEGQTYGLFLGYFGKNLNLLMGHSAVDSNYTADVGYVPRKGIRGFHPGVNLLYWPKSGPVRNCLAGFHGDLNYDWGWDLLDQSIGPFVKVEMNDQTVVEAGAYFNFTRLYDPYDPTGGLIEPGEHPLPVGDYRDRFTYLSVATGNSYDFRGEAQVEAGTYFSGKKYDAAGSISYRIQPVGLVSLDAGWYRIRQPDGLPSADFWLVGPRAEVSFRRDLFLSALFQFNTQENNFNLNARLQWRFRPVSDVFLVYTDNSWSRAEGPNVRFLTPKNRAVVLKVVYWLNV